MNKLIPIAIGILLSTSLHAESTGKKYDCEPEELMGYIKLNTVNLSMPSSITKPEEFTEALIETRKAEAAESGEDPEQCFNIWSGDIDLNEEWKELVDKLKDIDFDFDFSIFGGIDMDTILNKIGDKFDEAMDSVMEELDKGMCERLNEVDWSAAGDTASAYLTEKLDDKYNVDLASDDWWSDGLQDVLNNEMDDLGDYVFDSDELVEDIDSETKNKIRKVEDDFWDDI
jgi:hypothetical protein